jgi:hypothetical protein
MAARDVYNASQVTATTTKAATVASAVVAAQTTIDGSNSVVGYTTSAGNYGNLKAAILAANAAKAASLFAAEAARQTSVAVSRDTLRTAGDLAAF